MNSQAFRAIVRWHLIESARIIRWRFYSRRWPLTRYCQPQCRTHILAAGVVALLLVAADSEPTRDDVIAAMKPFDGKSSAGVDHSTLTGKVVCGYQGWFAANGDGSGRGWRHYASRRKFEPGSCS